MKRRFLTLFVAGGLLAAPVSLNAALISVDFNTTVSVLASGDTNAVDPFNNDGASFTGQSGAWNTLDIGPSNSTINKTATRTVSSLVTGSGQTTSVSFSFNPSNLTYRSFNSGGSDDLRSEVLFLSTANTATATSIAWEINGLLHNTSYALILFGQVNGSNVTSNPADFTVNGGPVATLDSENDASFALVTSDGTGRIVGTLGLRSGATFSSWSGFQIQGNFIPTPAALPAGLALLALAGLRRRRHA